MMASVPNRIAVRSSQDTHLRSHRRSLPSLELAGHKNSQLGADHLLGKGLHLLQFHKFTQIHNLAQITCSARACICSWQCARVRPATDTGLPSSTPPPRMTKTSAPSHTCGNRHMRHAEVSQKEDKLRLVSMEKVRNLRDSLTRQTMKSVGELGPTGPRRAPQYDVPAAKGGSHRVPSSLTEEIVRHRD
jgi:hypothetical protein